MKQQKIDPREYMRKLRPPRAGIGGDPEFLRQQQLKERRKTHLKSVEELEIEREKQKGRYVTPEPTESGVLGERTKLLLPPIREGKEYVLVQSVRQERKIFKKTRIWIKGRKRPVEVEDEEAWESVDRDYKIYRKGNIKPTYTFKNLAQAIQTWEDLERYGEVRRREQMWGQRIGL